MSQPLVIIDSIFILNVITTKEKDPRRDGDHPCPAPCQLEAQGSQVHQGPAEALLSARCQPHEGCIYGVRDAPAEAGHKLKNQLLSDALLNGLDKVTPKTKKRILLRL